MGVEKFGRYFRKKGWITAREEVEVERDVEVEVKREQAEEGKAKGKKGWFRIWGGKDEVEEGSGKRRTVAEWWQDNKDARAKRRRSAEKWWVRGESGTRWVVEFATAYAVVKLFLPLRIVVSVWGAPWFARGVVIPIGRGIRSMIPFLRRA